MTLKDRFLQLRQLLNQAQLFPTDHNFGKLRLSVNQIEAEWEQQRVLFEHLRAAELDA